MQRYSNVSEVPLSLAVFLATDSYDYSDDPNTISTTSLIKPIRQLILGGRVPADDRAQDLASMLPSRMGSALHDAIERAWKTNAAQAMIALGYPKKVAERITINPSKQELEGNPNLIPVYLEQRHKRQVGNWSVSGKYDFVGDGRVEDFKSTSVWTYMSGSNDEKYTLQGSIYRWIAPEIITSNQMAIQFIFTDWSAAAARTDPRYPKSRSVQKVFDLMPIQETEAYVRRKLAQIELASNQPESSLPQCSDADLWRKEPVFKYYRDPTKTNGRSTKNFPSREEAYFYMSEKGGGVVLEKPGEVVACKYCPAFMACSQKDVLIERGELLLPSAT